MNGIAEKQSRKEVEWRERLARFAASGQQIKSFCQAESVSEAVFYRWRKQLAVVGGVASADVARLSMCRPTASMLPTV